MYFFCIPCDFNIDMLQKIADLNSSSSKFRVSETYGQLTEGELLGSGRMTSILPKINYEGLKNYIESCTKYGIKFNYVLNPSCLGNDEFNSEGFNKIKQFVLSLYNIGIRSFTIALPSVIEIINSLNLDIEIKASAICEIDSPSKALFYKRIGAKRVVADPDITRKFSTLKNICDTFGDGVEILVNNMCMRNCAYKMFHYNHEAHCNENNRNQNVRNYYFHRCAMQKAQSISSTLKLNWIRPEDLKFYYENGIRYFKLQGRHNSNGDNLLKTLQYYFNENYNGDLMQLITLFEPYNAFQPYLDNKKLEGFVETFYKKPDFCNELCEKCNYCLSYAEMCTEVDETKQKNEKALAFYEHFDSFLKQ
ncbi:MAG: U32 family peptidase [Bacillota bacterium]